MTDVGYRGIVDMDYRHDARDDTYKLLDVNPRIGASFRLFATRENVDVVRALHLDLTGRRVPANTDWERRKWLVEPLDLATVAKMWHERTLRLTDWVRSYRGVEEYAWLARDDPRPFAAMVMRSLLAGGRRLSLSEAARGEAWLS